MINEYQSQYNIPHESKACELILCAYSNIDKNLEINPTVLELCKLPDSINVSQITELLNDYMKSRVSFYRETNRPPFIEDDFSEYFTAKSSNGCLIGGGNCAMDVKTSFNEGIDVACVIMKNKCSNEKSLMQNFNSSGVDLDTLFKDQKDIEAVNLFMIRYFNKIQCIKNEKNLADCYLLIFVTRDKDIFLICLKINLENIHQVVSGGFVKNKQASKNIIIKNFINPDYGKVTLYKSKKRLELRLLSNILKSEHAVKVYSMT